MPNAYFAKHVDDTMPQDSTQSTRHTSASVVKQELPSNERTNEPVISSLGGEYQHRSAEDESMCVETHDENTAVNSQTQDYLANGLSDEEIISSLSQTEGPSPVTTNGYQTTTSEHVDIDSVNGNIRDSPHTLGNVSQTMLEQANIPGEEEIVPNDAGDSAVTHSTDDENMAHNSQQPTWISCVVSVVLKLTSQAFHHSGQQVSFFFLVKWSFEEKKKISLNRKNKFEKLNSTFRRRHVIMYKIYIMLESLPLSLLEDLKNQTKNKKNNNKYDNMHT